MTMKVKVIYSFYNLAFYSGGNAIFCYNTEYFPSIALNPEHNTKKERYFKLSIQSKQHKKMRCFLICKKRNSKMQEKKVNLKAQVLKIENNKKSKQTQCTESK